MASPLVLGVLRLFKCWGPWAFGPLIVIVSFYYVFVYAFAMRGQRRLSTWDRLVWPRPFTRGAVVWRLWRSDLPRRADAATHEAMLQDLTAALNAVTEEAEALAQSGGRA